MKKYLLALMGLVSIINASSIYKLYGQFQNIEVLEEYCSYVGCSVTAPNDFLVSNSIISIYDTTLDNFYQSIRNHYRSNGFIVSRQKNKILVTADTIKTKIYITCDDQIKNVPVQEYGIHLEYDRRKCEYDNKKRQEKNDSIEIQVREKHELDRINKITVVYALVSEAFASSIGMTWNDPVLKGSIVPELNLSWLLSLQEKRDSLADFRVVSMDIRNEMKIDWGQIISRSVIQESEKLTISTNEYDKWGLSIMVVEKPDSILELTWSYTAPPPSEYSSGTAVGKGQTCALGAVDLELQTVQKVPFLGNIPYIGVLFKNEKKSRTKSRLYICASYY